MSKWTHKMLERKQTLVWQALLVPAECLLQLDNLMRLGLLMGPAGWQRLLGNPVLVLLGTLWTMGMVELVALLVLAESLWLLGAHVGVVERQWSTQGEVQMGLAG